MNSELDIRISARSGLAYDNDPEQSEIDNALARRIAADDEKAFNAFVFRWYGYVMARVKGRIKNLCDADEAVNDVFIRVWKSRGRISDIQTDYVRYFYGIIRNTILEYQHKHTARAKQRERETELFYHLLSLHDDDEERAARDEWRERMKNASENLSAAIERLALRDASILINVVSLGKSVRSTATEHRTTTFYVEKSVNASLRFLREELQKQVAA